MLFGYCIYHLVSLRWPTSPHLQNIDTRIDSNQLSAGRKTKMAETKSKHRCRAE